MQCSPGKLLVSEFKATHKLSGVGRGKNLNQTAQLQHYRSLKYIVWNIYRYLSLVCTDLLDHLDQRLGRWHLTWFGMSHGMCHSNMHCTPITDRNHPHSHELQTLPYALLGNVMTYPGSHAAMANVPRGTADRTAWRYGTGWRAVLNSFECCGGRGGMARGREVIPAELKWEKRNITKLIKDRLAYNTHKFCGVCVAAQWYNINTCHVNIVKLNVLG